MNNIQVVVLNEAHRNPAGMQLFLAKLTQRGEKIKDAVDLLSLYNNCIEKERSHEAIQSLASLPHGTIKRFAPITIAIVGASRRFLAQARTHQVGVDYVSGSLQYSDYSDKGQFVVPYSIIEAKAAGKKIKSFDGDGWYDEDPVEAYLKSCNNAMSDYAEIAKVTDNDTAGYTAPQGLRNILIMQGNHQSWEYFIQLRSCNRNTVETQYVALLIWEALMGTKDGEDLFAFAGPNCMYGRCREGSMSCGHMLYDAPAQAYETHTNAVLPRAIIDTKFPRLRGAK
jgi:thymidylate synthase (FAD)